jgi:hypothetical protein
MRAARHLSPSKLCHCLNGYASGTIIIYFIFVYFASYFSLCQARPFIARSRYLARSRARARKRALRVRNMKIFARRTGGMAGESAPPSTPAAKGKGPGARERGRGWESRTILGPNLTGLAAPLSAGWLLTRVYSRTSRYERETRYFRSTTRASARSRPRERDTTQWRGWGRGASGGGDSIVNLLIRGGRYI